MLRKIESLRKESKEKRNRFAFWVALGFTLCIALFWVASMPARVAEMTGSLKTEKVQGGFSRYVSNFKNTLTASVPKETEPVVEHSVENATIDFATFFTASTTQATRKSKGTPVLIGTTSTQKNDDAQAEDVIQ